LSPSVSEASIILLDPTNQAVEEEDPAIQPIGEEVTAVQPIGEENAAIQPIREENPDSRPTGEGNTAGWMAVEATDMPATSETEKVRGFADGLIATGLNLVFVSAGRVEKLFRIHGSMLSYCTVVPYE
jgi:hypothetical protein